MSKVHELKILPQHFWPVVDGLKTSAEYMVCPDTCVPPEKRMPQEEKPDITMRMSKRKTPTITRTCALPLAAFISPFTAVLTAVLPFSTACSMPERAADAPLVAALPPADCAAVPDRAAA